MNFPDAPVAGQSFSIWTFDGIAWQRTGAAAVKTARTRNRIINPIAQISQENGNTAQTVAGTYPVDQCRLGLSGIVGQAQRVTPATPSPEGTNSAVNSMATTAKASLAAGDYLQILWVIEYVDVADLQWGTAGALPVVLRFSAYCDVAGTYAVTINNSNGSRTYATSFVAVVGWNRVAMAIPGDTTGTWTADPAIGVHFALAAGSTYVGVPGWQGVNVLAPPGCINGAATANAKYYVTDVGLYADPDNTGVPPKFEPPSYEDDLARCQRYFQTSRIAGVLSSANRVTWVRITVMRGVPSNTSTPAATIVESNVFSTIFDLTNNSGYNVTANARM